jgi:cyclopropane-fatty-acyl-phospholipid synthase
LSDQPARAARPDFGVWAAINRAAGSVQGGGAARRVLPPERWLVRLLLRELGHPPIAIVLWDGEAIGHPAPVARVIVRDRPALLGLVLNPDLYFGDGYAAGRIEVGGDLLALLEAVYRAGPACEKPPGLLGRLLEQVRRRRSNTLAGARSNIHHHYDIGDDFYRLWLDRELVYTCAFFASPQQTLEEAQRAKMDLVCRKLWLRPGESVVEAGCGWGALALFMARNYGVSVKAYNVSHEQIKHARARARAEGLDDRVEFIEDDYRNIRGRFDCFASIGMLEHVGPDHYRELGTVIDRCLSPAGRGLLHAIGRDYPGRINAWIERRIFPGAHPPSLRQMLEVLEPWSFSVLDVENLRLHYAETLRHWLARFEAAGQSVVAMFDQVLLRAWRLYLTGSIAGFTTGSLQLFQVLFARHASNGIPWTRQRLEVRSQESGVRS